MSLVVFRPMNFGCHARSRVVVSKAAPSDGFTSWVKCISIWRCKCGSRTETAGSIQGCKYWESKVVCAHVPGNCMCQLLGKLCYHDANGTGCMCCLAL